MEISDPIPDTNNLSFPLVVKPNSEGSTIGLSIIQDESKLIEAIQLARVYDDNTVLIESFIKGREINSWNYCWKIIPNC